jgi:hypothetical protein
VVQQKYWGSNITHGILQAKSEQRSQGHPWSSGDSQNLPIEVRNFSTSDMTKLNNMIAQQLILKSLMLLGLANY